MPLGRDTLAPLAVLQHRSQIILIRAPKSAARSALGNNKLSSTRSFAESKLDFARLGVHDVDFGADDPWTNF